MDTLRALIGNMGGRVEWACLKQNISGKEKFGCMFSVYACITCTGSCVSLQAVSRPWEEEPDALSEETIRTLSMEIVREHLLDRVHEV